MKVIVNVINKIEVFQIIENNEVIGTFFSLNGAICRIKQLNNKKG